MDIVLGPGPDGGAMAHHPDCPEVQVLRAAHAPLMTLFEVQVALVDLTCAKHSCLGVDGDQWRELRTTGRTIVDYPPEDK